jgi:uncharacterized membrane protein
MTYEETHARSIAKTLTVRVLFSLSHLLNGFIVSGSWVIGASIVGVAALVNMTLHWLHERVWNWVQWNRKPEDNAFFKDGHPRTVSKSVTWRALITINNFMIPYLMTGSWKQAAAFLTIATVINIVIYYSHERLWNIVKWGKTEKAIEGQSV